MSISLTLAELSNAAQLLGRLQGAKKKAKHAYAIANYIASDVQKIINGYADSEKAVFIDNGIEAGEDGNLSVTKEHPMHDVITRELAELRNTRVDLPAFPVDVEELVEGMESFDDNPVDETMFFGLISLRDGTADKEEAA